MNLSKTDKELIAEIVEQKLRHYKLIGEPAVGVNEVYGPTLQSDLVENIPQLIKQPAVDVVEPNPNVVKFYDKYFSKAQQKEVEKELSEPKEEERWIPTTIGTEYWVISSIFSTHLVKYYANDYDNDFISVGNCFRTEEQAQSAATKIREILK